MLPFRPLRLLGNPHVQTVAGSFFSGAGIALPAATVTVALRDGDQVAALETVPDAWRAGDPIAVLVHGLGGCHDSGYMRRVARRLAARGMRVLRLDLRGCGAGVGLARRYYSAACSDDVRVVLEHLHRLHPAAPLLLAGFSLGGGIVLKLAGEAGAQPVAGLCAVAAMAPPLDLALCAAMIARQRFYDAFFVRNVVRQVVQHQRLFPDQPLPRFPRRMTLRQFDDIYTAPNWGFADALDYYRQASALPWVERAVVPIFVLTARDDPFIAVAPFESLTPTPDRVVYIAPHGGHLGFLGADGQGGIRWGETRVVDWLRAQAGSASTR